MVFLEGSGRPLEISIWSFSLCCSSSSFTDVDRRSEFSVSVKPEALSVISAIELLRVLELLEYKMTLQ